MLYRSQATKKFELKFLPFVGHVPPDNRSEEDHCKVAESMELINKYAGDRLYFIRRKQSNETDDFALMVEISQLVEDETSPTGRQNGPGEHKQCYAIQYQMTESESLRCVTFTLINILEWEVIYCSPLSSKVRNRIQNILFRRNYDKRTETNHHLYNHVLHNICIVTTNKIHSMGNWFGSTMFGWFQQLHKYWENYETSKSTPNIGHLLPESEYIKPYLSQLARYGIVTHDSQPAQITAEGKQRNNLSGFVWHRASQKNIYFIWKLHKVAKQLSQMGYCVMMDGLYFTNQPDELQRRVWLKESIAFALPVALNHQNEIISMKVASCYDTLILENMFSQHPTLLSQAVNSFQSFHIIDHCWHRNDLERDFLHVVTEHFEPLFSM